MDTYVFGYGSLINRMSIARTTVRVPELNELTVNRLWGFERIWDYQAIVRSELLDRAINAVYLNIRPRSSGLINGVTFLVTPEELERLQARERFYAMIECNAQLEIPVPGRAVTFMCTDPEHLAADGSDGFVLQRYIDIVDAGCDDLGSGFKEEFMRTTVPNPFPLLEGGYTFV